MADENRGNDEASTTGNDPSAQSATSGTPSKRKRDTLDYRNRQGVYPKPSSELHADSRKLCKDLLDGEEKPNMYPCVPEEKVAKILERFKDENETKLHMTIMPWVTPSAEDLGLQGILDPELFQDLFTDQYDREWSCTIFGSSKPKPDYAVGPSRKIFSDAELENLYNYEPPDNPFLLTKYLCFPFIMSEAKNETAGLELANRQNLRSGAIAVRAIIKLYEAAFGVGTKEVEELMCKILVFSISLDNNRVEIYGHFATRNPPPSEVSKKLKPSRTNEQPQHQVVSGPIINGNAGPSNAIEQPGDQIDSAVVITEDPTPPNATTQPANRDETGAIQGKIVVPVPQGRKSVYYDRYPIKMYDFREGFQDGKEKEGEEEEKHLQWFKPYNFVLNVNKEFATEHIERIQKAAKVLQVSQKQKSARSAVTVLELQPIDSISAAPNRALQDELKKVTAFLEQQRAEMRTQLEQQQVASQARLEQQRAHTNQLLAYMMQQNDDLRTQLEQQRADNKELQENFKKLLDKIELRERAPHRIDYFFLTSTFSTLDMILISDYHESCVYEKCIFGYSGGFI